MKFFTSDTHFYHKNIIRFCNRPYGTVEHMNDGMIASWNAKVGKDDEVFHLGDFSFCARDYRQEILGRLNGHKNLILGNHDAGVTKDQWRYDGFGQVYDYLELNMPDTYQDDLGVVKTYKQKVVLFHFPMLSWNAMAYGSWHLHGHCHGTLPPTRLLRLDVGVDTNQMSPYSYEDIKKIMTMRSVVSADIKEK